MSVAISKQAYSLRDRRAVSIITVARDAAHRTGSRPPSNDFVFFVILSSYWGAMRMSLRGITPPRCKRVRPERPYLWTVERLAQMVAARRRTLCRSKPSVSEAGAEARTVSFAEHRCSPPAPSVLRSAKRFALLLAMAKKRKAWAAGHHRRRSEETRFGANPAEDGIHTDFTQGSLGNRAFREDGGTSGER